MVQSITNYQSNLEKLRTFERVIHEEFGAAGKQGVALNACYEVQTDRALVELPFLLSLAKPRKWEGSKVLRSQVAYKHTVSMEPHEMTETFSREDVKFNPDVVKAAMSVFQDHARKKWYDKEVFDFLLTNPESYDGISLVSSSHTNASGTFDNELTAYDGTNERTIIEEAQAKEHTFKLPNGHVIDLRYTEIWCAGADYYNWVEATMAERRTNVDSSGDYDQTSNVVGMASFSNTAGGITPVVIDEFASGQYLFVDNRAPWKRPLILCRESGDPRLVTMDGPTDSLPFLQNAIASSFEQSWGVGVGLHDFVAGNFTAI